MSEDSLKKQMEKHGFSVNDINYIINYMVKESLSPQLAMRRIKSYEALEKKLMQKIDSNKMKQEHLSNELEVKTQALEEANRKLEELGQARQKEDEIRNNLESKSDMLDAELEELKNQLQMIQVIQSDQPAERSPEAEAIAKSVNHITNEIKMIIIEYEEVTTLFLPLVTALTEALADPDDFVFSSEDLTNAIDDFILLNGSPSGVATATEAPRQFSPPPVSNSPITPPVSQPISAPVVSEQTTPPVSAPQPISDDMIPSPTISKPPEEDLEGVVPSWQRIEEKKEEPKPEPLRFKPTDMIKQHEQGTEETPQADEESEEKEEVTEEAPSGQLSPSQIIKQRQKALAEREAKRREEEEKIKQLRESAMAKTHSEETEEKESQEEVQQISSPESKPVSVPESKPDPVQKKPVQRKPEPVQKKPEPKVDNKTKQVLLTFKDFISEAKSTKNFNERVKLISDQDAAYEVLGGIGLSQFYSYATKPVQMKDELVELIDNWIENGPPR